MPTDAQTECFTGFTAETSSSASKSANIPDVIDSDIGSDERTRDAGITTTALLRFQLFQDAPIVAKYRTGLYSAGLTCDLAVLTGIGSRQSGAEAYVTPVVGADFSEEGIEGTATGFVKDGWFPSAT